MTSALSGCSFDAPIDASMAGMEHNSVTIPCLEETWPQLATLPRAREGLGFHGHFYGARRGELEEHWLSRI